MTKFCNSIISMRDVITSILKEFDQKKIFFWRLFLVKFNNLWLALGMTLKFYTNVAKGLKLEKTKIQKVFTANSYGSRIYRGKKIGILNRIFTMWQLKFGLHWNNYISMFFLKLILFILVTFSRRILYYVLICFDRKKDKQLCKWNILVILVTF